MDTIFLKLNNLADAISKELKSIIKENKISLSITVILFGYSDDSYSYLSGMKKRANSLGIELSVIEFSDNITEDELIKKIESVNNIEDSYGLILQNPIPTHINIDRLKDIIDYKKDIDGVTSYNQGRLFNKKPFIIPATAWAVDMSLLFISQIFNIELSGINATIVGRSTTVGLPSLHLLLKRNITPTIVHTKTKNIKDITSKADIVVACCGVPKYIDDSFIKEDCIVIDVGIHYLDNKVVGDVNNDNVSKASIVTAVPGGIGAITNLLIFANAIKSYFIINNGIEYKFQFEVRGDIFS